MNAEGKNNRDGLSSSPLRRFGQVGFANLDADSCAKELAEKFGIGPFRVTVLKDPEGNTLSKVSRAWVSGIDFELIEAKEGLLHNVYASERGSDTMHHLCFYPEKKEEYFEQVDRLLEKGYKLLLSGGYPGDIHYSYFETTEDFGFVLELAYFPPGITGAGTIEYYIEPEGPETAGRFSSIGLVSSDCGKIARNFEDIFNTGKWEISLQGDPASGKYMKTASCEMTGIRFEVIEPHGMTGCIFQQMLELWGDTLAYLGFMPEDYRAVRGSLEEKEIDVLFEGGDADGGRCVYLDTQKKFGFIMKIYEPAEA